jgi:hypothetical protein
MTIIILPTAGSVFGSVMHRECVLFSMLAQPLHPFPPLIFRAIPQAFPDLHSDAASATARDIFTSSAASPHRRLPSRLAVSVRTDAANPASSGNATAARIVRVLVAAAEVDDAAAAARVWTVRMHLPRADARVTRCVCARRVGTAAAAIVTISDTVADIGNTAAIVDVTEVEIVHYAPLALGSDEADAFFPLRGAGARPAPAAGAVAEATIEAGKHAVEVEFHIE